MGSTTARSANDPLGSSEPLDSGAASATAGVRGWLLILCVMMTIVGPVISIWIVASEFDALAPLYVTSRGAQWATILAIALTTCAIVFGIYAGLRLWTVKPHALRIAKAALCFGLAVDACTTTISTIVGTASADDGDLFYRVLVDLVPSLVFFTICLAYLNKSRRVESTYGSEG